MKRTLLILFTVSLVTADLAADNELEEFVVNLFTKHMANYLILTEQEVHTCMNKTNLIYDDVEFAGYTLQNKSRIIDFNDNAIKLGCFLSCIAEKKELIPVTNANLDIVVENIKNIFDYHVKKRVSERKGTNEDELRVKTFKVADTCVDQVKSEPDQCKMSFKFFVCYIYETNRLEHPRLL